MDRVWFMAMLRGWSLSLRSPEGEGKIKSSEHVRRRAFVHGCRLARGDEIAGNHLRVAGAGADHRIHAGVRVDHHFEEGRAGEGEEIGDGRLQRGRLVESSRPGESVGLRGEHEILLVQDRKSTRLNSSHPSISYAVF